VREQTKAYFTQVVQINRKLEMKTKYTTTFTCEIITPMFLNGAEAGNSPELRTQSFKGGIRFWWRALQSSYSTYNALREAEVKLFGGSYKKPGENNEVFQKSNIKVCLLHNDIKIAQNLERTSGLDCNYRGGRLRGNYAGIGYLLYSTYKEKQYIEPDQIFQIELSSTNRDTLHEGITAFYAMSKFGSVGTRARRGAGSFDIVKINSDIELSLEELERRVNVFNQNSSIQKHSSLCGAELVQCEERFDDWKSALNEIGEKFADFRTRHKHEIFKTPAFGIPIIHSGGTKLFNDVDRRNKLISYDKRSSPLWIKISKDENGYYWQLTKMAGDFLPDEVKIAKVQNNRTTATSDWDPSLVTTFMNQIKQGQQ
jgi:CRISPR-associated protein Cmr1